MSVIHKKEEMLAFLSFWTPVKIGYLTNFGFVFA